MRDMSSGNLGGGRAISATVLIALLGLYGCGGGSDSSGPATGAQQSSFALRQDQGDPSNPTPPGPAGDQTDPSTPTGLSGSAASPSRINLSWTASTDNVAVTGYRVFRNGALRATLANVLVYQDNALTAATSYSYTVQAFDAAGNDSAQSTAVIVTTPAAADAIAPSVPVGVVATPVSVSRINLSWSASTDNVAVTGYRVFRDGALVVTLGNVITFADSPLNPGTTYVYSVRALDAAGNVSGPSAATSAT